MASRIDDGSQPTAHTAIQAMIVRAHQVADQTGKAVGVHYDLGTDQISLVEIGPDVATETAFLRIASPAQGETAAEIDAPSGDTGAHDPADLKAASA